MSIPVFGPQFDEILVKTNDSNTVYIIAVGKLFKTKNGGLSWEYLYVPHPKWKGEYVTPSHLAQDPTSKETIYVGASHGLFKSIDGGKNWTDLSAGVLKNVSWIKVIDSMKIYVLSEGKLYKTMNAGKSWGDITSPATINFIAMDPKSEIIYTIKDPIVYPSDIFYSNDGGLNWQKKVFNAKVLEHGKKYYDCKRWTHLKISPLNNKLLFALCDVLGGWPPHLLRSSDGGNTWKEITARKDNVKSMKVDYLALSEKFALFFDSNDENIFYITGFWGRPPGGGPFSSLPNGFLKTTDGGRTYEFLQIDKTDMEVNKISSAADPLTVYAATPQGVYKTKDGGKNWRPTNIGLPLGRRSDVLSRATSWLSLDRENHVIYHVIQFNPRSYQHRSEVAIYKSEDGGLTWQEYYRDGYQSDFYNPYAYLLHANPIITFGQRDYLLGSVKSGILKIKEPDSSEWKTIKTNVSHPLLFNISQSNPKNLYLIDEQALYISEDGGFSWFSLKFPLRVTMVDMKVNEPSQPIIYILGGNQLYKSEDGGKIWIKVSPDVVKWFDKNTKTYKDIYLYLRHNITTFAMDHSSPNTLFFGTKGRGIYRTTNGGKTWAFISEGLGTLEDIAINSIAIDPKNPNTVYAGTNKGVFRSLDKGAAWKPFNNGLPDLDREIKTIRVNNSIPQLIVLETKGNIWRLIDSSSWDFMKKKWETLWK